MGVKKRSAPTLPKSEEKRARFEAGLDLELNQDLSETTLQYIVKEVKAPTAKQDLIDSWVKSLCSFISSTSLPKLNPSSISDAPFTFEPGDKYPGATVVKARAIGGLATKSLIFPEARGTVELQLNYTKLPANLDQLSTYWYVSLVQLKSRLVESGLIENGSVEYQFDIFSALPSLVIKPTGKLSRHLSVSLILGQANIANCDESDLLASHISAQKVFSSCLHEEIKSLMSTFPSYRTLLLVLKIWARQVHFVAPECFLEVLILHCHLIGYLTTQMNAWQGLRKLWSFVSNTPLDGEDLILGVADPVPSTAHDSLCPLLDKAGNIVLFPGVTRIQWKLLVLLATKATNQPVEQVLLTTIKPEAFYDRVFKVIKCSNKVTARDVITNLVEGLGERISCLGLIGGDRTCTDRKQNNFSIEFGVRLDPVVYGNPSTLGPESLDNEACAKFRRFWGERSQLRRFQDGSVREAVVWGDNKEELIGDIVRAVLSRHHGGCELEERGTWGESILQGDGGLRDREVLDSLIPQIYGLDNLPLAVAGVTAVGPASRGSRIGQTIVKKAKGKTVKQHQNICLLTGKGGMTASSVTPLDVVLNAEHSGKWPKDIEAVRRVRAAWLMAVGRALSRKVDGLQTRMKGEKLLVMKDRTVLRMRVGEKGDINDGCELSSWLSGLTKIFPAWSGAVRLCLRWVSAHLLSSISSLAVEVTVAAALSLAPYPPTSPTTAFILWLSTIVSHDWNSSPLCAPGCATDLDRSSLPPLAVLVPHSPSPSYWTKDVSWPELQRLVNLAAISLTKLQTDPLQMFVPNLSCYEALIRLKPLQVCTLTQAIKQDTIKTAPNVNNDDDSPITAIPIVDHDPVSIYVQLLTKCYGTFANFYYDRFGGTVIAVKLRNQSEKIKLHQLSCKMVSENGITNNWGAMVEDWKILGDGLVKEIEIINSDAMV